MRIGELARAAGVKAETIRYYEREGVLASPPRTQANYRDYGPEHARRLNFIRRARDLGFSMTRIRDLLELADDRSRACHAVDTLARAHLCEVNRKIADLEAPRRELRRLLENCEQGALGPSRCLETPADGTDA